MASLDNPEYPLIHLVDMRTGTGSKIDLTFCGLPVMECELYITQPAQFMDLPLDESCCLCEIEMKRAEFTELDNQE